MPESPVKRMKPTSSKLQSAAASVIVSEPALLQLIAHFIPSDQEAAVGEAKQHVVLNTIASLCRAIPGASASLGPEKEAFWRRLVLLHLDFGVGPDWYNITDSTEVCKEHLPKEYCNSDDENEESDWAAWCRHPLKVAMDEWKASTPDASWNLFFDEDYDEWDSLGVRFRPSQYGFLQELQEDESLIDTNWPDSEHAFSLFSDLVILQRLVRPLWTGYQAYSDGEQFVTPVLLSPLAQEVSEGHDFGMLKHCSLIPPCWYAGEGVSKRWSGIDAPLASVGIPSVEEEATRGLDRDNYATEEECDLFPISFARDFLTVRHLVHSVFDDWRRVFMDNRTYHGPIFHIGRSKRSGRWIRLLGECNMS